MRDALLGCFHVMTDAELRPPLLPCPITYDWFLRGANRRTCTRRRGKQQIASITVSRCMISHCIVDKLGHIKKSVSDVAACVHFDLESVRHNWRYVSFVINVNEVIVVYLTASIPLCCCFMSRRDLTRRLLHYHPEGWTI